MSIKITDIYEGVGFLVRVSTDSSDAFKELVRRATNTWDQAPPEIKKFADELIHGHPLQDYASQTPHVPIRGKEVTELLLGNLEELAICKDCGGKGYHHMHNCPTLTKK